MNINTAGVMLNAGPWLGFGSGIAALATIPNMEAKLLTCAVMFAVAAGSAMRRLFRAVPAPVELSDYPFDARTANPWECDGGPLGF
jgi:hypothetical protein